MSPEPEEPIPGHLLALVITPDSVQVINIPSDDLLAALCSIIGCRFVNCVPLSATMDMWVDDEYLYTGVPLNRKATELAIG